MPFYSYHCNHCGSPFDAFHKIESRNEVTLCLFCNSLDTDRVLTAPMVRGDYPGYECPVTGAWIEGRKAHEENLRKHGCRLLEPGESRDAANFRAQEEARLESSIDSTVEQFVETLPTAKKEKLAAEMEAGFDAQIVRK